MREAICGQRERERRLHDRVHPPRSPQGPGGREPPRDPLHRGDGEGAGTAGGGRRRLPGHPGPGRAGGAREEGRGPAAVQGSSGWDGCPSSSRRTWPPLEMLQREMQTVEESLYLAREKRDALARSAGRSAGAGQPGAAPATANDLDDLQAQLAALRSRYTDEHPDVESLRSRIARAEARLAETQPPERSSTNNSGAVDRDQLAGSHPGGREARDATDGPRAADLRHPGSRRGHAAYRAGAVEPDARLRQAQRQLHGSAQQADRGPDGGPPRAAVEGRALPDARPRAPAGEAVLAPAETHPWPGAPGRSPGRARPFGRRGGARSDRQGRAAAGGMFSHPVLARIPHLPRPAGPAPS